MKPELSLIYLYPKEMNIYGDRGNVVALMKRAQWRGIKIHLAEVGIGDSYDLTKADIIFAGGGQDRGQISVGADLQKRAGNLREAVAKGTVILTVCGSYQLFGRGFITSEGQEIPGIGIFKATTRGSDTRMIGNIILDSPWGRLVGFENHSGQTELEEGQRALGRVVSGYGNTLKSGHDGAITNNCFGTYLHGPILPKNPRFADHLLKLALGRKYGQSNLAWIDDKLERAAADIASSRPQ